MQISLVWTLCANDLHSMKVVIVPERLGDRGLLRVTFLAALSGVVDGQIACLWYEHVRHSQYFVGQRPARGGLTF